MQPIAGNVDFLDAVGCVQDGEDLDHTGTHTGVDEAGVVLLVQDAQPPVLDASDHDGTVTCNVTLYKGVLFPTVSGRLHRTRPERRSWPWAWCKTCAASVVPNRAKLRGCGCNSAESRITRG